MTDRVFVTSGDWAVASDELRRARKRFRDHKYGARTRGIPFLLAFEEWWVIWWWSGYWHERGPRRGQYVMARYGDCGPYAVGNVKIIRAEENCRDLWLEPGHRARLITARSVSARKQWSDNSEYRAKMSVAVAASNRRRAIVERAI